MTNKILVDPDGDLLLLLQPITSGTALKGNTTYQTQLLLSSKHMILASPTFKALLEKHDFKEGLEMRVTGKVEVSIPEDYPTAFTTLAYIAHCRHDRVSLSFDLHTLTQLAILVDKYQMHSSVKVFADIWVRALSNQIPNVLSDAVIQWLCLSWVFHLNTEFRLMSKILQQQTTGSVSKRISSTNWDVPVPQRVIELIENSRTNAIIEAQSQLQALIRRYEGSTLHCSAQPSQEKIFGHIPTHRSDCDSMVLGSLIKGARAAGVHLSNLDPMAATTSYGALHNRICDLQVRSACDRFKSMHLDSKPSHPYGYSGNSVYGCGSPRESNTEARTIVAHLHEALQKIADSLSGLDLDIVKAI